MASDVVLKRDVSVGTEGTGKHGDVAEYGFPGEKLERILMERKKISPLQRFVQDVGDLVFEVLSGNYQ